MISEHGADGQGPDDARNHDRAEGSNREGAEHLLEREEGTGEGRVEGAGDAGGGTAADQDLGMAGMEPEPAPERGAQGCAEHGDRPLATSRGARAQGKGGRNRADKDGVSANHSVALRDRQLDIGNVLAVRDSGAPNHEPGGQHAERGQKRQVYRMRVPWQPGLWPTNEDEVSDVDEAVEGDDPETAGNAYEGAKDHERRSLVEVLLLEPVEGSQPPPLVERQHGPDKRAESREAGIPHRQSRGTSTAYVNSSIKPLRVYPIRVVMAGECPNGAGFEP